MAGDMNRQYDVTRGASPLARTPGIYVFETYKNFTHHDALTASYRVPPHKASSYKQVSELVTMLDGITSAVGKVYETEIRRNTSLAKMVAANPDADSFEIIRDNLPADVRKGVDESIGRELRTLRSRLPKHGSEEYAQLVESIAGNRILIAYSGHLGMPLYSGLPPTKQLSTGRSTGKIFAEPDAVQKFNEYMQNVAKSCLSEPRRPTLDTSKPIEASTPAGAIRQSLEGKK